MKKERKHYTAEEKVAILRRHLVEQVPVSELCDKLELQPTVFYRWQKEFFEDGAAAFQQKARPNHSGEQERIAYLEKKIQPKDEVLAELMAEHVALRTDGRSSVNAPSCRPFSSITSVNSVLPTISRIANRIAPDYVCFTRPLCQWHA